MVHSQVVVYVVNVFSVDIPGGVVIHQLHQPAEAVRSLAHRYSKLVLAVHLDLRENPECARVAAAAAAALPLLTSGDTEAHHSGPGLNS